MYRFLKVFLVSIVLIFNFASAKDVKLKEPPESLSKYYPPNSENYEYLFNMYKASTAFTGLIDNIKNGDWINANKWVNVLKDSYLKIGEMVPEWKKYLRKKEINALVRAVEKKDGQAIQIYANAVGKSCTSCHSKYLVSTKILYHYPSYDLITLEDPITKSDLDVEEYMKKMTNSLKLLNVYLSDGKKEDAVKSGIAFAKRFKGLTQMCTECHTNKLSEEIYFGKEINKHLKAFMKAVKNLDKKKINKELSFIEFNNCSKCHNVHQTPALLQEKFGKHKH
jgi:hypothetical protein